MNGWVDQVIVEGIGGLGSAGDRDICIGVHFAGDADTKVQRKNFTPLPTQLAIEFPYEVGLNAAVPHGSQAMANI